MLDSSASGPSVPERAMLGSARFRWIIGMSLLIMAGFGLIIPALPQFVEDLGRSQAAVAAVVFAFSLTRLLGDLFVGTLIDRLGERNVTAVGAAIVGISSVAAGWSGTYTQLLVLRGLGGFGSSFFLGGLMAYLIGSTPVLERGRALSVFQGSFGIGLLVGPAIGGAMLGVTSPRAPFFIYGAALLVCVPAILRTLVPVRERDALAAAPDLYDDTPPAPRVPAWRQIRPLMRNTAYVSALACGALALFLSTAEITILKPFWTNVLHQSKASSGMPFTVPALFSIVVIWHAGAVTDRRGRKSALVPALAVVALATAAIGYASSAIVVLGLLAIVGLGSGYIRPGPSAMVADVSSPETRAVAVAGYRFAGDLGALIGPVAGVIANYVSYSAAWVTMGVVAAAVFVLTAFANETLPR